MIQLIRLSSGINVNGLRIGQIEILMLSTLLTNVKSEKVNAVNCLLGMMLNTKLKSATINLINWHIATNTKNFWLLFGSLSLSVSFILEFEIVQIKSAY